jgi:N-acetyl-gamma-glutamyl-phosphate reductase
MSNPIPAAVIGASGYVGGELLRLVAGHPVFDLQVAVSDSAAGKPVGHLFGHLATALAQHTFTAQDGWLDHVQTGADLALFSAAPHGASAAMLAEVVAACEAKSINLHVVDSSADFRFAEQGAWEDIYGQPHGAPQLLERFTCALPEHAATVDTPHVGHPGCFATASTLAVVPLVAAGLTDAEVFVSGVTGSTGSGKTPVAGTHHPERNSNLYAYKPLAHRHAPEVAGLAEAASGRQTKVHFVPHSGPFARGIHVTVQAKAHTKVTEEQLRAVYEQAYAGAAFVQVVAGTPRIKNVVASNQCHIGVATDGESVVIMAAIDNLVKGAAGGAVQWMNRLWGLPETAGLDMPAPGWT